MTSFVLLLELFEAGKVRAACDVEDINDPLELSLLKLDVKDVEISSPASPVLDLVKRAGALCALLSILVGYNSLDLSCPVDDG